MSYNWKDDYVVNGRLKDGWYYIRTWEDMKNNSYSYSKEEIIFRPDISQGFTKEMERRLPPTRCVFVVCGYYTLADKYKLTPEMVTSPAFTIGKEYEFSDDGDDW